MWPSACVVVGAAVCARLPPSHSWELVYELAVQNKVDYNAYADVKVRAVTRALVVVDDPWCPRAAVCGPLLAER